MTLRRALVALAGGTALLLAGCVAAGPQPEDAIPPALLASDLGILEANAGDSVDGLSVNVWASFLVERDEVSADDLREVLRIVVDNTHITNITSISISALGDEIDEQSIDEQNVRLDLVPAAEELGLTDPDDGLGSIRAGWDEVVAMLEGTR